MKTIEIEVDDRFVDKVYEILKKIPIISLKVKNSSSWRDELKRSEPKKKERFVLDKIEINSSLDFNEIKDEYFKFKGYS